MSTAAQPAIELTWMDAFMRAELSAFRDFQREFEGKECGACGSEKWAKSPFCRLCSIRLQRAHLMQPLKAAFERDDAMAFLDYFRLWDRCRDYLINLRREAA